MPAFETMDRLQKAVYWAVVTRADDMGQPQVSAPVELNVRWVWKQAMMRGADGNPVTVDAQVVVDQECNVGGAMFEGELADWLGSGSADMDNSVMEIVAYNETPDIKNRNVRRTVGLKFYKDVPPALEQ